MSQLSMPPMWVGFALLAMAAAIGAAWWWTAPKRVEARADRKAAKRLTAYHAAQAAQAALSAIAEPDAYITRRIDYPGTYGPHQLLSARHDGPDVTGHLIGYEPAPVLEHTMPDGASATWQGELKRRLDGDWYQPPPTHHAATWPNSPPAITEHAADALTTIIESVRDPRISDKAAVMRATAALAGITVTVQPLMCVALWGVSDHAVRDRIAKELIP